MLVADIRRALARCRAPVLTIAIANVLSVSVGIVMVHTGNEYALTYRDSLVARAHASDPASLALQQGARVNAALLDFGNNLFVGAVPLTLTGAAVVGPYPITVVRGWIGGIVSVDRNHASRLNDAWEAVYYLLTLTLQLVPYTLAGGVGVNVGWAYFRPRPYYVGEKWIGYPREAVFDALRVYILIVPLFLIASLWEFLAR